MNAFELTRLPGILRTRWRWPLGVALGLALCVSGVYGLMMPVYRALAAVALDTRGVERLLDTQRDANPPPASLVSTDMDVIRSEAVLGAALSRTILGDTRALDAGLTPTAREAMVAWRQERRTSWMKDTEGNQPFDVWLLRWIAKPLTVQRAAADSGVVTIQFDHPNAEVSRVLCNALADAYLAVALELSLVPTRQAATFFASQVEQSRQLLAQAQATRNAFQRAHGLVSVSEAADVASSLMSDLIGSSAQASARGAEAAARSAWAVARPEASPEVLRSDSVQKLDADIARSRAELAELQSRLGEQHPQLQARRQQLDTLLAQRREEAQRQADAVQQAGRVAQGSEQAQRVLVDRQREQVLGQKAQREQLAVLQQDVDAANHRYQLALERHAQIGRAHV